MRENLRTISKLLGDFDSFINSRSVISLIWPKEAFPKILEWHFEVWKKEYEHLVENKTDEWSYYGEISGLLDSILKKIAERSLKEGASHGFFVQLEKHAEKYEKELVPGDEARKYYYVESLLNILCKIFFENVSASPERYDIWEHYFPKRWKITRTNLDDKENIVSKVMFHQFLEWAQERILQPKEDFDKNLEDVSRNLFPEVEPILWATILYFVLSSYGENRARSVVEQPQNFGFIGRTRTYSGFDEGSEEEPNRKIFENMRSEAKAQKERTFELVYQLSKRYAVFNQFSKKNLEDYIKSLNELEGQYPKESREESRRKGLLRTFSEMLAFLGKK